MQFIQWPRDDIAEPILQNCVSDARQTAFSSNVPTCYERADMVNGKWLHTFVNGEFVVSHTVEVCDTIYDIRVSVGDCCPPPPPVFTVLKSVIILLLLLLTQNLIIFLLINVQFQF